MISIYLKDATEKFCKYYCDGYKDEISGKKIKGMVNWIFKRASKLLSDDNLNLVQNNLNRNTLLQLRNNLTEAGIKSILACEHQDLIAKYQEYNPFNIEIFYNDNGDINSINVLKGIFNYKAFRKYKSTYVNGFLLAKKLSIKCCPYCNRNYTTQHETVYYKKNEINDLSEVKRVFPEFDHFYAQGSFPVIAVSFYNLIPSCNICNSHYKGDRNTLNYNLFNPYTPVVQNHFNFKFIPNDPGSLYGAGNNFSLDFKFHDTAAINQQVKKSIEFFDIKANYEKNHSNLINEIVGKKLMFSKSYLNTIQDTYGISFEESYRILFESYYESDKQHQRPFSKLKKDIFDDTDI